MTESSAVEIAGGTVLLVLGVGIILLSIPRRGEALRPHMRSAFAQSVVPPLCLALIVFGIATVVVSL